MGGGGGVSGGVSRGGGLGGGAAVARDGFGETDGSEG